MIATANHIACESIRPIKNLGRQPMQPGPHIEALKLFVAALVAGSMLAAVIWVVIS